MSDLVNFGEYYSIRNRDGKAWRIPKTGIRTALEIYQPSTIKGRLFKSMFPVLVHIPILGSVFKKYMHVQSEDAVLPRAVLERIRRAFDGPGQMCLSFYDGPFSPHRKTTIQICEGKKILGYCKLSSSEKVKALFFHELAILKGLKDAGVEGVPDCLLCETLEDGTGIFIQSTIKSNRSKTIQELSPIHINFLKELCGKTTVDCAFQSSEYYSVLVFLKGCIENRQFCSAFQVHLEKAIAVAEEHLSRTSAFSVYHGDFTPWNCFVHRSGGEKSLYAFDFEYAYKTFPRMLDVFHFFTQTRMSDGLDAHTIFKEYRALFVQGEYQDVFDTPHVSYILYLLGVIGFYCERDGVDNTMTSENRQYVWVQLLELLLNEVN